MLALALVASAAILLWWSYTILASQHETAQTAAAEVSECRSLASRIVKLRGQPVRQPAANASKSELIGRITTAATAAGFDDEALDRIEPQGQHAQGDGAVSVEETKVYLRKVTLRQALTFLHALDSSGAAAVSHLRLTAPQSPKDDATAGNTWTVEATLSRTVSGANPGGYRATAGQ